MTIHCAVMYLDPETKSLGYFLGSDSRLAVGLEDSDEDLVFQVDKSFSGERTIGFQRSEFVDHVYEIDNLPGRFDGKLRSLDNVFDKIEEGVDYSNISFLQAPGHYALLIGKYNPNNIDLYTVSNTNEGRPNTASRLHRITVEMFSPETQTFCWYAPCTENFRLIETERINFWEAWGLARTLLTIPTDKARKFAELEDSYHPGKPNIYVLNFDGISKVE